MVVFFIGIAGVIGYLAYRGWQAAEQRRESLAALAARLGWSFDPEPDDSHDEEYAHFEMFRRGHGRRAYNTLAGPFEIAGSDCRAKAGDFLYKITTSNGKTTTTHTHHFSYLIVHLPFAEVGDLFIRPEHFFDRIASTLGFDDIDFESDEFSRRFLVKSPDKRFAYAVVHPRMMEFLLDADPVALDIEQGRSCLSDGSSPWTPEAFEHRMTFLKRFFALWPPHVLDSLGVAAPTEEPR